MRILDVDNNELQEEEIDFDEGYLEADKIFKQHHDEIPAEEYQWHYGLLDIYFNDGTSYTPQGEDDPHIKRPDNPHSSKFEYIPFEGENPRTIRGMSLHRITDVEGKDAIPAWDEYEDIQRYKLYTEEEKATRKRTAEDQAKKEELITTGLDRLIKLENKVLTHTGNIKDITMTRDMDFEVFDKTTSATNAALEQTNITVDDLVLTMADLIGIEE